MNIRRHDGEEKATNSYEYEALKVVNNRVEELRSYINELNSILEPEVEDGLEILELQKEKTKLELALYWVKQCLELTKYQDDYFKDLYNNIFKKLIRVEVKIEKYSETHFNIKR